MKSNVSTNNLINQWMRRSLFVSLLSASLLLGNSRAANAQISQPDTGGFSRIEQPVSRKVGVAAAGFGLIGLELWWFLFSKNKAQSAQISEGIQVIDIAVDGGYSPDQITVQAGQPVQLNFLRKDPSSCLEQVILPDFNKALDLPLNQNVTVEVLPQKAGSYTFHCGMNMFHGTITAREASGKPGQTLG